MESLLGWAQNTEAENARRHSAEDAQLQNALAGATTLEEKNTILQNARTKNPGMIERMVARLKRKPAPAPFTGPAPTVTTQQGAITNPETGEQISAGSPQTVQGPAPKLKSRDEATAQWAARGVTPEQQKADFARKQLAPDYQAKVAALKSVMPDASDQEIGAALGIRQPTIPWKNYVSSDGKQRQSFQAGQEPEGWQIAPTGQPKYFIVKKADGTLTPATVQNGKYVSPTGETIEGAQAFVKPPAPPPTLAHYVELQSRKIMADNGQGQALTPQEEADLKASGMGLTLAAKARADEMAIAQAQWAIAQFTDPESGVVEWQTKANLANRLRGGEKILGPAVGTPTGKDKSNAQLADSAIQQVDTMLSILDQDPHLTGPGGGQWTAFNRWIGSNSPDSQQFLAAAILASEHGVAVFGGRNIHSIKDLQDIMGEWRTKPGALKAGLNQIKSTMEPWSNPRGRLPAPKNAIRPKQGEKKKWSKKKWAAANPGKDVNAAAAQAAAQGREVID